MINLEVCANSLASVEAAQQGGAFRVELCDNLTEGGTTPSFALIKTARELLQIELNVLIRPRGGDFLYSKLEFEMMETDIKVCGDLGCNGVVIGMLNADGSIDLERCLKLINIAKLYQMQVTFHRAFDCCDNFSVALEQIIKLGCNTILTSGGQTDALSGAETLHQLIHQANNRITIMPGGGITTANIQQLVKITGLKIFHGSFRQHQVSKMRYLYSAGQEYNQMITSPALVKQAIILANNLNE